MKFAKWAALAGLTNLVAVTGYSAQEKNTSFLFPDESGSSSVAMSRVQNEFAGRNAKKMDRDTLVHLKAGTTDFHDASFANDYSSFHYGEAQGSSFALAAQYDAFRALGRWGAFAELGMAYFSGELNGSGSARQQTRLTFIPVTLGVVYTADLHRAMRYFLPSVSLGVSQNIYLHNGTEDQLRARGNYLSTRTALGLRHSLDWVGFDNLNLMGEVSSSRASEGNLSTIMLGLTSEL